MGGRVRIMICLAVGVLALLAPGAALAQGGTTTSAGDQQYVDPLAPTTSTSAPPTTAPSAPPPAASPNTAPTTSAAAPTTAAATATAPASAGSGRTLPFTGFDLFLPVGIGVGLLGAGLLLLRLTRQA